MSKADFPWVKWDYEAWLNGTFGLSMQEVGVYDTILNLIYDKGGPIKDDIAWLARRMSMRPTSLEKVLQELVKRDKIERFDGVISNKRAEKEIKTREKIVEKWKKNFSGGEGNHREKTSNINTGAKPSARPPEGAGAGVESKELKESGDRRPPARPAAAVPPPPALAKRRAERIDPRRKASDLNVLYAVSKGLNRKEAAREWEKFVAYYRGLADGHKNSKSGDWDAVWESWVLRTAERLGRDPLVETNGHGHKSAQDYDRNDWIRIVEVWRITNIWPPDMGPEPGRPGCMAPIDVVNPS